MYNRIKVIAVQRFEFEDKIHFPGEVSYQIERVARRWISRGIAKYADPNAIISGGYIKHPKVSIVILVKDALYYVKKCLKSLNAYTDNYELIIVDNDSKEKTKKYLKSIDFMDFTLITNKENKGFSYGNNQGIKIAKYDYICSLNSDTLLSPNWLGKLMRGFKFHKDVGIVGPSTCFGATVHSKQTLINLRCRLKDEVNQEKVNQIAGSLPEDYKEAAIVGFCWIIKKELFEKIGVYDYKRYGLATWEDIDLLWRASKTGFKSVWCVASYVHHFGNKTTIEMGLDPRKIRVETRPIFVERKKDPNLYIENDVKLGRVRRIKGVIPILMITWDRLEYTKQAIEALLKNTKSFKLFIFDNNSTDGTIDYLKSLEDDRIEIYYSDKNTGLVPPINHFLKKFPNHRYIAKVDNDTVVSKDWLRKLKEVMDEYPFLAVEANHYLMIRQDIETNDDFFKHFFSIDFKGNKLYLCHWVGGTGTIIRRSEVDEIPDIPGTLGGWGQYQHIKQMASAFYTGVWIDRLDQVATNKYKEPSDYPEYDKKIDKLRNRKIIGAKKIDINALKKEYEKMENWYKKL